MIDKIFITIPLVFQFIPVLLMVYYVYAIFGMQFFNANHNHIEEGGEFAMFEYSDFTTFGGSLLILFHINYGVAWSFIVFDYAHKFDNLVGAVLFFDSFHIII
jgi:hypothetical protein